MGTYNQRTHLPIKQKYPRIYTKANLRGLGTAIKAKTKIPQPDPELINRGVYEALDQEWARRVIKKCLELEPEEPFIPVQMINRWSYDPICITGGQEPEEPETLIIPQMVGQGYDNMYLITHGMIGPDGVQSDPYRSVNEPVVPRIRKLEPPRPVHHEMQQDTENRQNQDPREGFINLILNKISRKDTT